MRSIVFLLFFFANQLRVFWKKFYLPISTHAAFNDPSLCTNPGIKNIRIAMITNNSLAVSLLLIKENNQRGFGWFHKLRHCLRFTLLCAFKWCAVCVAHDCMHDSRWGQQLSGLRNVGNRQTNQSGQRLHMWGDSFHTTLAQTDIHANTKTLLWGNFHQMLWQQGFIDAINNSPPSLVHVFHSPEAQYFPPADDR